MKKTLSCLILLTVGLAWSVAQDATATVQVAPSDQVIYPDSSQILNKTEPKVELKPETLPAVQAAAQVQAATQILASPKPLVAATPVPARKAAVLKPSSPSPLAAHGWFLRWTVTGDEAGVKAWSEPLGPNIVIAALGPDLWEVLSGPLAPEGLKQALSGQAGRAQLVKR